MIIKDNFNKVKSCQRNRIRHCNSQNTEVREFQEQSIKPNGKTRQNKHKESIIPIQV